MEFNFSIRNAIKKAWALFRIRPWYFVGLAFVMLVINVFSNFHENIIIRVVIITAAIIWSYTWLSIVIATVDGKEGTLGYQNLKLHLPTFKQFFMLVCVGIATGIIVIAGFIMLIIPGIYFMVRLAFSNLAYVDRQRGVRETLKYTWHLVKGDIFWTVFLTIMVAIALIFLGVLAAVVGVLVTYPLAMLVLAQLYRSLVEHHAAQEQLVEQPAEIPPAEPLQQSNTEPMAGVS